jgi:hypothetical protein
VEIIFGAGLPGSYIFALRSRSALLMTDTELRLIAAAAIIGDNNRPKNGYSRPAATGTPSEVAGSIFLAVLCIGCLALITWSAIIKPVATTSSIRISIGQASLGLI